MPYMDPMGKVVMKARAYSNMGKTSEFRCRPRGH